VAAILLWGVAVSAAPGRAQEPQLFYETDGSGEVVVLVPDWAHDTGSWFRLLPLLRQEGRRLVRYDLRGQGRSGVPADGDYSLPAHRADLLRLLDGLGIDRAHLVGTGLGATVALGFALEHPGRAISVSAIDPRLRWDADDRAEWEQILGAWERVGRPTLGEYTSVLVARWVGTDFVARNAWAVAWYDLMLRRQSAAALIESMRAFLATGWDGEGAPPVDVPALLLLGERWEGARDSGNLGSGFRIQWRERVEDAGAQPALDAPGELAERLRDFLGRVSP
jgi:pimeloyl-ACP methyl ester carboxylesterase